MGKLEEIWQEYRFQRKDAEDNVWVACSWLQFEFLHVRRQVPNSLVQRRSNGTCCASLRFGKQRLRQGPRQGWSQTDNIHINHMCEPNVIIWFSFCPTCNCPKKRLKPSWFNSSFAQKRGLYLVQQAICHSVFGLFAKNYKLMSRWMPATFFAENWAHTDAVR